MFVNNNRGIALLITLTIITVIIAVTFELNRQMRASVNDAAATRDMLTLTHMIATGVDVGKAILVKDKYETEIDSVQEEWANPEIIEQYLEQVPLEKGKVSLSITDERSRIQINSLVKYPEGREFNPAQHELWQRFISLLLTQQELENESLPRDLEPDMIINPVKDWLDKNDDNAITGLTGAEDDYYRSLEKPYGCRNGPVKDISELLRIRNIPSELFQNDMGENTYGISNFVTAHGISRDSEGGHSLSFDGKININTAEIAVIAALMPMGQEFLAEEIVEWREEKSGDQYLNDLSDANWYKQVPGVGDVEIKSELVTTSSELFRIECIAELEKSAMSATVIVEREKEEKTGKWQCKVLNWTYN